MLSYELKKLYKNKFLIITFALLLVLTSLLAVWEKDTSLEGQPDWDEAQARIEEFKLYKADPEGYLAEYTYCREIVEEYQDAVRYYTQQTFVGNDAPMPEPIDPALWEAYNGRYKAFIKQAKVIESLPEVWQKTVDKARINWNEQVAAGLEGNRYHRELAENTISIYTDMPYLLPEIRMEYARGWDHYFAFTGVNLCLVLFVLVLGVSLFGDEQTLRTPPILRATPKGRWSLVLTKAGALCLVTAGAVLIFSGAAMAVFSFRYHGLSSLGNFVQAFKAYALCPYMIKVGEYLALSLMLKWLALCGFGALVAMLSVLLRSQVLTYLAGGAVTGIQLVLHLRTYTDIHHFARLMNLFSVMDTDMGMTRYLAPNLFRHAASYQGTALALYALVIILCVALSGMIFCAGGRLLPRQGRGLRLHIRIRRPAVALPNLSRTLYGTEMHKTLIAKKFLLVVVLLLAAKLVVYDIVYQPYESNFDIIYKMYMDDFTGPLTDERLEAMDAERARLTEIIQRETEMSELYEAKQISSDEYNTYLHDLRVARARSDVFSVIEARRDSLLPLREAGGDPWLLYDTGWNALNALPFDVFLYAALLLLLSGLFADEKTTGVAPILRATVRGRRQLFTAKLGAALTLTLVLFALFRTADWYFIARQYALPSAEAPMQSLTGFFGAPAALTVRDMVILRSVAALGGYLVLALLCLAFSMMFPKAIHAMAITASATLLPYLVRRFGLEAAKYVDLTDLMAGSAYLARVTARPVWGILFAVAVLGGSVALIFGTERRCNHS